MTATHRIDPEVLRYFRRTLGVMTMVFVAMYVAVDLSLGWLVRGAIMSHSSTRAESWLREMVGKVPAFDLLVETGMPDAPQRLALEKMLEPRDVLQVVVFDDKGVERVAIDQNRTKHPSPSGVNENARAVAESGEPRVFILDGTGVPDRPDVYAEVYAPIVLPDGRRITVEAYIDETPLATSIHAGLGRFADLLLFGGFLAFLLPAGLLTLRTARLRAQDRHLIELSRRDVLTGLANRSVATEQFDRTSDPDRESPHRFSHLLYLDVDRFKTINDSIGHAAGDGILRHVAQRIAGAIRGNDLACRFGGDEFVILLKGQSDQGAIAIANRIMASVDQPIDVDGSQIAPTVSIGVAPVREGDDFDAALGAADRALYVAKANGRQQAVLHDERLDASAASRRMIEDRLRTALEHDAFYLEYQPIYCGRAERLEGFEALLRLQAEDGSNIPPATFIPVAEDCGLIDEIGAWVLSHALGVAATWPDDIFIAVNVSALQLGDGRFPTFVEGELRRTGVLPQRLEIELTESVLLGQCDGADIEIAELKALGVRLALDDFGTGYSSLAHLWRYPFDTLKIDRGFLEGFEYDSEKYRAFIATIVHLGHDLGTRVTAEGLETTAQLAMLESVGVEGYQGYLLGRPLAETVATDYAHRRPPPPLMVVDHSGRVPTRVPEVPPRGPPRDVA